MSSEAPDRSPAAALAVAHRRLGAGLAQNASGRPGVAARQFRAALRALGGIPVGAGTETSSGVPDPTGTMVVDDGAARQAAYVRARAMLGLAMSEYEVRADVEAGLACLAEAERNAGEAGAPGVSVAVEGQRGLLLLRAGRSAEALAALDRGVDGIAVAEPVDACCLLLNRGTLNLDLGRLDAARADLRECARRADAVGDALLLFKARHNLGYLEHLAGDLPLALATMADAAILSHGASPAIALLDRAHVLLEAGLVSDAEASLARAAALFVAARLPHDLAETELALARCALLNHRPADAVARARASRRRFVRRGNEEWVSRAEMVEVRARLAVLIADDVADRRALAAVARKAATLGERLDLRSIGARTPRDRARFAWATAAEAYAESDDIASAYRALARAGRHTGREPLGLAVQLSLARADTAFAAGRRASGVRHVRAGQALLADHRRHLGSMEALTSAAVHGERLAELDMTAALRTGAPAAILDAVERARATWAGPARVRPPADPELAELMARLRRCLELDRLLTVAGTAAEAARRVELRREAAGLRALVRERSWREHGTSPAPAAARAAHLLRALRRRPGSADPLTVVDVFSHRGWIHAVTARAHGLAVHRLTPAAGVGASLRRVGADLGVLATPTLPSPLRSVAAASLDRGLAALDSALLAPLGVDGPVHVVAPGALAALPWGQLPSRRGVPTSVATRLVVPSADGEPAEGVREPRSAVALAGPHLRQAEAEAHAVAEAWPSGRVRRGPQATCAAAVSALRESSIVHLAAHGRHEVENPVFSWLHFADGPLFAYELEGLHLPRSLVVLSACEVGQVSESAGGEALGFAGVLVRLGASAVVAAVAPLGDDVAAHVMPALHALLAAGQEPAEALAAACERAPWLVPLVCITGCVPGIGARPDFADPGPAA